MKKLFYILLLVTLTKVNFAQKVISNQQHAWVTYQGNHKLTSKIGLHTEYQWRRADYFQHWQQSLLRVGVDYYLHPNAFFTVGYGNIITYQYGDMPVNHPFNEHRIWQQFNQKNSIGRFEIQHRYRLEQRFMDNYVKQGTTYERSGTNYRNRIRYRCMAILPINHKSMENNTLFLNVNDEVFLGFGEGIGTNILDQNRLQFALGFKFNSALTLQAGYLNQYLVKNAKVVSSSILDQAENNHTITFGLTYNLDFTK
jgi:hypothetical protein